jgi:DnaJ-class molecular chaperone
MGKLEHEKVLGVQHGASHQQIRQAYQGWLRRNNPNRETDPDERWAKQQVRKKIDAAYLALVEPGSWRRAAS